MSEELIQRNLYEAPEKMGAWDYYNIGSTTLKALKVAKIIPDHDYAEYEGKKPDALIVKRPQVIAAIEYKQPKELRTKKQIEMAILQEIGTARALGAKIYIVTDGQKTFWINPLTGNEVKADTGESVSVIFNKSDVECIRLIGKAIVSLSATNDVLLQSAVVDPLPLAQKVWQDLWAVSGATAENCLYTFVEIFIFKYLSDLGVLTGLHSFSHLIAQYSTNTENEVIEYYASTVRVKIKELFPWNPKDKTTIINGTIFVSKDDKAVSGYATVFKKILERFRDFGTLENIDYDFKSKLFETFLKESISKNNWGQFFTPLKVVRAIVNMADINPGMKICDPACGVGKFLLEPILRDIHRYFKVENGKLIPSIRLFGFDKGFDKDEQKTIILAKANMLIYLSAMIREHSDITRQFAALFNDTFLLQTNSILGTLAKPTVNEYDLILTNPPYVMSGSSNLKDEIGKRTPDEVSNKQKSTLEQHYSVSAMGVEGLFMEWIVRALVPGGKAFVVVPDGIMNRSNDKRLRDFILDECDIDAVISLPINTFFTTNKKTYIMALTKKVPVITNGIPNKARQATPVFTYLCSEIGETRDVYRFDLEQNDLDTAAQLFNMFKGVKNNRSISQKLCESDKRCKVVDIDEFYNGSHWSVERWWTHKERIELGIEDEDKPVSIGDFISIVNEIASTITEFTEPLRELEKKKKDVIRLKQASILDESVFNLVSGGLGLNKTKMTAFDTQCVEDIPVYTASKEPVAFIKPFANKLPIQASVSKQMLSFATNGDGSAGRNFVVHTRPFYLNVDRIAIEIVSQNVLLPYIQSQLSDMKEKYGFSHSYKANRHNLASLIVQIPVNDDGEYDVAAQSTIAEQYVLIEEIRSGLREKYTSIKGLSVPVDLGNANFKQISLANEEYFKLSIGKRILHKDFRAPRGDIPFYSANVFEPFAFSDVSNITDFSLSYVIWGIDGDFNFNCFPSTVKFGTTDHCGSIQILDNDILPNYLAYALRAVKHRYGFDRGLRASLKNMRMVDIAIPVDSSGKFDVAIQQKIAEQFKTIEACKSQVLGQIDVLIAQRINY